MVKSSDDLWEGIVAFIESEGLNAGFLWMKPVQLTRKTELEKDLRMTGPDADDFLCSFIKKFPFDIGDFNLGKYFEGEGFWPLPRSRDKTKPLNLGMLEQAVRNGVWNSAELDGLAES